MKSKSKGAGYSAGVILLIMVLLGWAMPKVYSSGAENSATRAAAPALTSERSFVALTAALALAAPHKVAFASDRTDDNFEIYTMNDDGTAVTRVTSDPGDDVSPTISPDGTRIAFVSNRDGDTNIYVMNVGGSGQTQLTSDGAADLSPSFSPDGSQIAFVSSRTGNDEIFVMNADGSNETQITNNPASDFGPTWSPDGTKIAFASERDFNSEIYIMLANGSGQTNLSLSGSDDLNPAWSFGLITFQSDRSGNFDIFSMNDVTGSGVTNLTNNAADDTDPARSLNNAQFTFMSTRDGNYELYTALADGTSQTRVTTEAASDFEPSLITINVAPTLDPISNLIILANSGNQVVNLTGISAGLGETQGLTVTAVSNNTAVIPNPTVTYTSPNSTGSINFTPVPNTTGSADITVTVTDDGGTANGGVNTFSRTFTVTVIAPDMTVTKTHSQNFNPGASETYTIIVTNSGAAPTSAPVTVTDTLPIGLTPTAPTGAHNGWTCSIVAKTLTCTRNDVLAPAASYPPIILVVNVANPAPLSVTNTAMVAGGGEINTTNNTSSDLTNINCSPDASLNNLNPLVISEFRLNGPGGSTDEFIEISNPTDIPHTVASGNCTGGYGVFASAGNGVISNTVTLVCAIPNGMVIPAKGQVLCSNSGPGGTYSLGSLGAQRSSTGSSAPPQLIAGAAATAAGDFQIVNGTPTSPGAFTSVDIPNDAGLLLANVGTNNVGASSNVPDNGDFGFGATGVSPSNLAIYDRIGFAAYGSGAPLQTCQLVNAAECGTSGSARPSLADNYCEGGAAGCLRPVGDASTTNHGSAVFYGDSGQYSLLRRQTTLTAGGTTPQDSNNNTQDILMVAPRPGINIAFNITNFPTGATNGVVSVLGAAGPQNSLAATDLADPGVLQSRLFDTGRTLNQLPNAERRYVIDDGGSPENAGNMNTTIQANNPLGSFIFRFGFRNVSVSQAINQLRFRIDQLAVPCGQAAPSPAGALTGSGNARNLSQTSPNCQGSDTQTALLKVLNMPAEVVSRESSPSDPPETVRGSVIEDTNRFTGGVELAPNGGGINNSLVRTGTTQGSFSGEYTTVVPAGPGPYFYMGFRLGVVKGGSFKFIIQPEGSASPAPTVP